MLYTLDKKLIEDVPYRNMYDVWRSRLTDEEYDAMVAVLDGRITCGEVHTSSWIPGHDWTDTVFQPIYEKACRGDEEASAMFFGLILWEVMMHRPEAWMFGHYEKDGIPIKGLTYFRVEL